LKKRALFLDRDGVLNAPIVRNGKPFAPKKIKEIKLYSNIKNTIKFLKNFYYIIVISNQPDVGNGIVKKKKSLKINSIICKKNFVSKYYLCFHSEKKNCKCRKPKIKSIISAKKKYKLDLSKSFFVGDRKKDIDAGNKSSCITIFIDRIYKEEKPKSFKYKCKSTREALIWIKNNSSKFI